jgi:hypothetical protein
MIIFLFYFYAGFFSKVRAVAQRKHDEAVASLMNAQGGFDEAVETRTTTEMAASLTEREHAELLNQVREMLVWRKWSTEQVAENELQVTESLEGLRISRKIIESVYDVPEKLNLCSACITCGRHHIFFFFFLRCFDF